ncbi:uncharacterized protein LOC133192864 [Saccostrea echinata]|uniref:uncharacterized protein LOC133192864 n=1 Tax=Saccostrea echinata TaxID=191078 RepID=UPI002A81A8FF|nr:uncharacterized protein LOC133192864 [Saccostrea echinata]
MADVPDVSCSIACVSNAIKTPCTVSSRFPHEFGVRKLSECKRPIYNHLRQCSVSNSDIASEGQLIAVRCGLFEVDLSLYTVCPFHRDNLGIAWHEKSTCQYPLHEGRAKPYRRFTLQLSKLVFSHFALLVPVGSGICRKCIDLVHNLPDIFKENLKQTDLKAENVDEKNFSSDVTQRCAEHNLQAFQDEVDGIYTENSDQFSSQESPHLSQISNWSEENTTGLEAFNSLVQTL